MKIGLLLFIEILTTIPLFGQSRPDTFSIDDYIKVLENDSILIYYNCTGTIVNKKCAEFIRVGKVDSINTNVSGRFFDYYIDGTKALEATMENDHLDGEATYYYENGNIKSTGKYKHDKKVGTWTYYYENGKKNKVLDYINDYAFISEYFNRKGKQKVVSGNGKYKGEFYSNNGCEPFEIFGKVKSGKMEGKWTLTISNFIVGNESFENGRFIKGYSGTNIYDDYQRILIDGFSASENVYLEDTNLGCPGDNVIQFLLYKRNSLKGSYYPELLNKLTTNLNQRLPNQWLIVGLKITKESELKTINVKSSVHDDNIESTVYDVIDSMKDFTAPKVNGETIDFDLFFTILIREGQIFIPVEYIYRNR